jgi:hypothetical protein
MKRILVGLLLCACSLVSCLELEQTVVLRSDGSGTQRMRLAMTERSLQAARAQANASLGVAGDPARIFDAAAVRKEIAAAGMECTSVRTSFERRRRVLEVEAAFDAPAQLRASPLTGGAADWLFERVPGQEHAMRLTFYPRGRAAFEAAQAKAAQLRELGPDREKDFFERSRPAMDGLRIKWALELPGDVRSCSPGVTKVAAQRVEVSITDSDIKSAEDLVLRLAPRFEVVFDAAGCAFPRD